MNTKKPIKPKKEVIYIVLPILIVCIFVFILVYILIGEKSSESGDVAASENDPTVIDWSDNSDEETIASTSEQPVSEPVVTSDEALSDKPSSEAEKDSENTPGITVVSSEPSSEPNTESKSETEDTPISEDRIVYQEGFYYEPLSEAVKERITGVSYKEGCIIPYEDLRYVSVLYVDFNGNNATGELIVNKAVAQDFVEIFYDLYIAKYQIEKIRLVDEYDANDRASMADNNTSAFNYRIVSGTDHLSQHAYGTAIDVNPFYNPYCEGDDYVSPPGSEIYADRSQDFAHKIDENDLCYQLFIAHGFSWGGAWKSCQDYQHFQKKLN